MMGLNLPQRLGKPFFVRVHGRYGTYEPRAVIDAASELCLIRWKDALEPGYAPSCSTGWAKAGPGTTALTPYDVIEMPTLMPDKVEIGSRVSENVPVSAYDFIEDLGVDLILGHSFLRGYEASFDFAKDRVALTKKSEVGSP